MTVDSVVVDFECACRAADEACINGLLLTAGGFPARCRSLLTTGSFSRVCGDSSLFSSSYADSRLHTALSVLPT